MSRSSRQKLSRPREARERSAGACREKKKSTAYIFHAFGRRRVGEGLNTSPAPRLQATTNSRRPECRTSAPEETHAAIRDPPLEQRKGAVRGRPLCSGSGFGRVYLLYR